jgi:IS30 family transposase
MIALLLRRDSEQALTVKQQIETLRRLNVRSTEIAQILGRTPTYVNKELTGLRKAR